MKKFQVSIEGIVPLLQARHPSPEEENKITKTKLAKKEKRKELTEKEQFDIHAYKIGKKFVQPAEMIEAAMVKAAVQFRLEGKKTYKDVINGGVFIEPVEIPHKIQKVSTDARWGKNPNTRGAIWVVRPRFDKWGLDFTLNLLQDERVSPETLRSILDYAGLYVGIGAWRPKYGRFNVIKFKEIN